MSAPVSLRKHLGTWTGLNRFWLEPGTQARESNSVATLGFAAREKFISFTYTWEDEGKPQEGLLLMSQDPKEATVKAVWIDSWHMSDLFMHCQGISDDNGIISILGSYAAPTGPDWGWRIVLDPGETDRLVFRMYNITPEGEEMIAVETIYVRQQG
jgi:hypothetical protein